MGYMDDQIEEWMQANRPDPAGMWPQEFARAQEAYCQGLQAIIERFNISFNALPEGTVISSEGPRFTRYRVKGE